MEAEGQRRTERIAVRVDPEVDQLLREAAALEHKTLSAFLLDAARERAVEVLDRERRQVLSDSEFARVMAELDRPAQVIPELLKLAERAARYQP